MCPSSASTSEDERIPQEIESLVGIGSSAIRIFAVHDTRLVWMQLQTTVRQPSCNGASNKQSVLFSCAVNHRIIAISFELKVRKFFLHPHVERVMQEEIG